MGQRVGISAGRKSGKPPASLQLSALETALLEHASSTSMPVDLYIGFVVKRVVFLFGLVMVFYNKK